MDFIYKNKDTINQLLICNVCKNPYTNPVFIPALDIRLCRACIPAAPVLVNKQLDEYSSIDGNIVHMTDQLLRQLLDELLVQCVACGQGDIQRKDFPDHRLHECPKRIVLCSASDLKCSWSGKYEDSNEHIRNCTFEFLRPILIDNLTYRKQIETYDQILANQQNEIEQLKNRHEQPTIDNDQIQQLKNRHEKPTIDNDQIQQLQNQLEKYDDIFANQQNQLEQLQNQLEKYDELFANQQNEIEQLKNSSEETIVDNDRFVQLQNQLEKHDEMFAKQQNQIEQLQNPSEETTVDSDRFVQLQNQLEKHDEMFTKQQNEIEQLKNSNEETTVDNDRFVQLQNQLEKHDEMFSKQQSQIQELKTQFQQYDHRLTTFQNSFRIILQETQSQRRARDKESQESASIQQSQIDEIQRIKEQNEQLKDQLEQLLQEPATTDNNEIDLLKQRLNQIETDSKQIQEQCTNTSNQLKQLQKQDTYRNNEITYLRQCREKQEVQICLLARKKSVIPRSYATIDDRIDDLIETYPKNADINLSSKRFDNQDMELICKRTMFDKQCRKLRLESNDVNAKGATILADSLYGNSTLNELYLSDNCISDIGAHAFAQVLSINNYSLTWLELNGNHITDEGVEYLSEMLKTNKTLILLGLNSNQITDRGAQTLAGTVTYYNETLQWLLLASNRAITDESVESFNDMITNNSTLQALWLKDCNLSKKGIRQLQEMAASKTTNFVLEL